MILDLLPMTFPERPNSCTCFTCKKYRPKINKCERNEELHVIGSFKELVNHPCYEYELKTYKKIL